MEMTISFRLVAAFVHLLARALSYPMRLVYDLTRAERIGIDEPGLFERLLMKIFPYREITKVYRPFRGCTLEVGGKQVRVLYLRRFFLTGKQWPIRIFLHHICLSDDDRAPHDHPFDFVTCPVKNSYTEWVDQETDGSGRPADIRLVDPGDRYDNPAEHVHRVFLGTPMWSLVIAGPSRRDWGFVLPDGKHVSHREYLNTPDSPDAPEDVIIGAAS